MKSIISYQQRVVNEKAELDLKLNNLRDFLMLDSYKALSVNEQVLLRLQNTYMQEYSSVLNERILLFNE